MEQIATWIAPIATTLAALITASNLGARITGYGFVIFTVGSLAWLALGYFTGQSNLLWQNAILTALNLFGVWRWLGVRARIEEGARAAQEESRDTPGEELFPASLLGRARLTAFDGSDLGHAVDAMIGCSSGRLTYLVASEGGLAGVGETLRRMEWRDVVVEDDEILSRLTLEQFRLLPAIEKDEWPG